MPGELGNFKYSIPLNKRQGNYLEFGLKEGCLSEVALLIFHR